MMMKKNHRILQQLIKLDTDYYLWCNRFHKSPAVMKSFRLISRTGDGYCYTLIALLIFLLDGQQGKSFMLHFALAFALEIPAFIILKRLFKRLRPFETLNQAAFYLTPSDKFSLPSGHSAAAGVMCSMMVVYYPALADIFIAWALLVMLSRIMLGVHYPSDTLAGALLGFICTGIATWVLVL